MGAVQCLSNFASGVVSSWVLSGVPGMQSVDVADGRTVVVSDKPKFILRSTGTLRQSNFDEGNPQFAVWKTKIIHLSVFGCTGMTVCGYRFSKESGWKSSIGIPENSGDRVCLRCMYGMGGRLVQHETGKWTPPWPMYGRRKSIG